MARRLGIYIHIPFCASKCSYCDFYSLARCDGLMPDYQKALLAHLKESAPTIKNYEVDSVYFGGGTPSYYGADRILEILNALKLNNNLRLDSEITVECNPDSINLNAMKLLRNEGVNRLSIGVQASDNNLLKLIGRRHNFQQAVKAVSDARAAGFDNVSVDLMYGLPSQTRRDWAETLQKIIELHPEHISCYGLKLEEGTPMYESYYGSPLLPDDDEQAEMYAYAVEMLKRFGYEQYEISNFAIPGFESRHNMKYWDIEDYMGFGPGAHSCTGRQRFSYVRDLKLYIRGVESGKKIVDEYEEIDDIGRAAEYIMLAMRMNKGMNEKDYRRVCKSDWQPIIKVLQDFKRKGWVEETDGNWHFNTEGFLVSNSLIGILIEAQSEHRIKQTPWLGKLDEHTLYPMSEDERIVAQHKRNRGN